MNTMGAIQENILWNLDTLFLFIRVFVLSSPSKKQEMRLTCAQRDLANALIITNQAVDLNNTLPILNNVYLKAEGQKLYFLGTNLEIAISYWINAEIKNEGEITIPSKLFTSYVNYLNSRDTLQIALDEGGNFCINTSSSKTKIKGIPSSDFPKIPVVEKEGGFKISSHDLSRIINQVAFTASLNSTRPILSGVYFTLSKNQLEAVATDSYRLSEKQVTVTQASGDLSCIIPVKTLHQIGVILSIMKQVEEVEVVVSKNQILFIVGDVKITSRLIDGQFPNYKQIIPKGSKTKVNLRVSELTSALKQINLFAKENNNKIIFNFTKDSIKITTDSTQYGEGEVVLSVKGDVEINEIALNSQYILDVLGALGSDEVVMGVENKVSPAVFQPVNDSHYTYIIMPLKI